MGSIDGIVYEDATGRDLIAISEVLLGVLEGGLLHNIAANFVSTICGNCIRAKFKVGLKSIK